MGIVVVKRPALIQSIEIIMGANRFHGRGGARMG